MEAQSSTISLKENERIDDLERNNLKIIQDTKRFCFGMDAVLLSGFVRLKASDRVLDMGTGTGIIPILLTAKTKAADFTALEIQPDSADMAERSVKLNGLEGKIKVVTGDIKDSAQLFKKASFDAITCNPPYMIDSHGIKNPDDALSIARHEVKISFDEIASNAAMLLKTGGKFFLVHRPFRLAEIIVTLSKYGLEPKRMKLVYPYVDSEPNMVLIEAVRGGKSRITVEKPLIVFKEPGKYTDEITDIYGY